ncbi:MAG: peroxidase family protein, partial [Chloroflexota bacterium]
MGPGETRPRDGFRPTKPQQPAGMRIEPSPSFAWATATMREATQVGLTAMHTLFVREHNRLADEIRARHPVLTGEEVYQAARRIVSAQMQVITYREFLPLLLGDGAIRSYRG